MREPQSPRGRGVATRLILGPMLLLILLLAAAPALAASPEIEFVDGAPMPPNVRPAIICSGSDYEMGYQYFNQLITIHGWEWWLGEYVGKSFNENQTKALKANQWLLMQNVPWAIEFLKGCAAGATDAGAEMTYAEVLAYFAGTRAYGSEPEGSQDVDLPPSDGTCSGFAAWGKETKDGSLIVGANGDHQMYDHEMGFGPDFVVMFYPEEGNSFVCSTLLRNIWHPGMNNKGLSYVHHGGGGWGGGGPGSATKYSVARDFRVLDILRTCDTAEEAKAKMIGFDGGGIWADVSGNAFQISRAEEPSLIREPGHMGEKQFIYAANNNTYRDKDLEKDLKPATDKGVFYIPHAGYLGNHPFFWDVDSITRNLSMWNMLHNYRGKVDIEFAKMMYRFVGKPPAYKTIEQADADFGPTLGKGWYAPIGQLGNVGTVVCRPDNGDAGVYYVAATGANRNHNPLCEDYYYYYPDELHSFYKLTLAETPGDVLWESRQSAHHALYYANQQLRKLTYKNPAYAPLDKIFNDAVRSWFSAQWERDQAEKTDGYDAVMHQNKALRAFAKCEAYANHVYESLVPAPATPQELGLKKWGGKWGEWATRGYPWDSKNKRDRVAIQVIPPTKK